MKRFLGAVASAAAVLMAVASGAALGDQCLYNCYDQCQEDWPGEDATIGLHATGVVASPAVSECVTLGLQAAAPRVETSEPLLGVD